MPAPSCVALERGRGAGRAGSQAGIALPTAWECPAYFGTFYLPVPACLEALVFGAVCEQAGNAAKMFCSLGWGGVSALLHLAPAGNPGKCLLSQPLGEEKHQPQAAVPEKM